MTQTQKFVRTYKQILLSAGIIVFSVLGTLFVLIPAVQKTISLADEMSSLSDDVARLDKKLSVLNALDDASLRDDLTAFLTAIPSEKSFPTIFATVEAAAAQSKVSIVDMSITGAGSVATQSAKQKVGSTTEKQIGARLLPFSVSVIGQLPDIEAFISKVTEVRRMLHIRTFSVNYTKSGEPISLQLLMNAFYEPLPTNLGGVGKEIKGFTDADYAVVARIAALPLLTDAPLTLPESQAMPLRSDPFSP